MAKVNNNLSQTYTLTIAQPSHVTSLGYVGKLLCCAAVKDGKHLKSFLLHQSEGVSSSFELEALLQQLAPKHGHRKENEQRDLKLNLT